MKNMDVKPVKVPARMHVRPEPCYKPTVADMLQEPWPKMTPEQHNKFPRGRFAENPIKPEAA